MLILNKIKEGISILAAFFVAGFMIFLFGKNSIPKELTNNEVEKIKKRVRDEQKKKSVFDKLSDIDNDLNS